MLSPYFVVLYLLGGFYLALCVSIVRKSMKPSCRTCLYWQECSVKRLGIVGLPPKRCF